jgi:hypothetical protein
MKILSDRLYVCRGSEGSSKLPAAPLQESPPSYASQEERVVPKDCKLRRVSYLSNVTEQDHRFVKKKVRASQCFKRFHTAQRTLEAIEAIHMIGKGQVKRLAGSDAQGQSMFVASMTSGGGV